jgi:hypothetical protein
MIVLTLSAVQGQPQACVPTYGENTSPCGYQCYGTTSTGLPNPCGDCAETNACGPSCCDEGGQQAEQWMNSVACNYQISFRTGSANCGAFTGGDGNYYNSNDEPLNTACTYPGCQNFQTCNPGVTYQTAAGTETSDVVCSPVSPPCSGTQYQTVAPTANQDRVCEPVTVCDPTSLYQTTPPTSTTNAVCSSIDSGLAIAVSTAQVLAYNGNTPQAAQVLQTMLAIASQQSPVSDLRTNATQLLVDYQSGYSTQYDLTHYISSSLQWDVANSQLDTSIQMMQT